MTNKFLAMSRLFLIGLAVLSLSGCASWGKKLKAFLGGKSGNELAAAPKATGGKFSENPNMYSGAQRQYKRVTKQSLEQEAALDNQAGSLWVMEGQGAYLFAQNIVRMIGDPIAITIEGEPREQLQAKADVIKKLLAKLEERQQARLRAPAAVETEEGKDKKAGKDKKDDKGEEKAQVAPPPVQKFEDEKADFSVKSVPTRIVERTVDGNYRVKGTQSFMIGSREYKIIVTGIVRAEDFNEDGISAAKLLDSKFDVVSNRKREQESL